MSVQLRPEAVLSAPAGNCPLEINGVSRGSRGNSHLKISLAVTGLVDWTFISIYLVFILSYTEIILLSF